MTSPSFWTHTCTQLLSGKSWSDAVTTNVSKEMDEMIKAIQAKRNALHVRMLDEIKKQTKNAKSCVDLKQLFEQKMKALH